jgi:hypothetical protein
MIELRVGSRTAGIVMIATPGRYGGSGPGSRCYNEQVLYTAIVQVFL